MPVSSLDPNHERACEGHKIIMSQNSISLTSARVSDSFGTKLRNSSTTFYTSPNFFWCTQKKKKKKDKGRVCELTSGKAGYVRRDSTRYPQVGEDTSYDSTWEIQVHAHRLCRFAFPWSRRIFGFLLRRRVDRDTR